MIPMLVSYIFDNELRWFYTKPSAIIFFVQTILRGQYFYTAALLAIVAYFISGITAAFVCAVIEMKRNGTFRRIREANRARTRQPDAPKDPPIEN